MDDLDEAKAPVTVRCECGEWMTTNDPYMLDEWNGWHEDGSFLAGKYHKPLSEPQHHVGPCPACWMDPTNHRYEDCPEYTPDSLSEPSKGERRAISGEAEEPMTDSS